MEICTIHFLVLVEPVGAMKPKISIKDSFIREFSKETNSLALLCPAQAFPVPFFR